MNVPPSKKAKVYVVSEDPEVLAIFEHSRVFFATLGYASEVVLQKDKSGIADDAVSAVTAKATIYMPFAELVDLDKEIERLTKEEEKLKKELAEANDKYLRLMAEYDNFRKRSAKERLELTDTAKGNVINGFLPVFDNFERALGTETQDAVYKQGVE